MNYQDFITPELLVLVPVLFLIGTGLKRSAVPDKLIPLILGAASIALSALYVLATADMSGARSIAIAVFTATTQGILIAGASVYVNQIVKQSKKDE